MIKTILFSFWFFLPAGCANMAPILAAKIPLLSHLSYPIDFYKTHAHKRVLGDHKTIRGLISGILVGILVAYLQNSLYSRFIFFHSFLPAYYQYLSPAILGGLLGFGALTGDIGKSFLKRRMSINPGKSWFLFDQLDYIIGGFLMSLLYVKLSLIVYVIAFVMWFFLHIIVSFIGFLFGLKDAPI